MPMLAPAVLLAFADPSYGLTEAVWFAITAMIGTAIGQVCATSLAWLKAREAVAIGEDNRQSLEDNRQSLADLGESLVVVSKSVNGNVAQARKDVQDGLTVAIEAAYQRGLLHGQGVLAAATEQAFRYGMDIRKPPPPPPPPPPPGDGNGGDDGAK